MHADVVIIGAGPAGCAVALELVRLGRSVVVQRGDAKAGRAFGECLPPAANPVLTGLRLPAPDPEYHLPSFGNRSSWGSEDLGSNDFLFNPYGHGWHLDRARFDAALRTFVEEKGIPILSAAPDARWIADCTGRGSVIATGMGARTEGGDRLVAFAALAQLQAGDDPDATTLTEAAPEGWWYSARLTHGRRVVSFQTDGDLPACQAARHADGFLHLLGQTTHVKTRMSGYRIPEGFPVALAAGGRWLAKAFGNGWVAVGDAAQSYDPLSSQGLVAALECATRAALALHAALDGDYRLLRRYQTMLEMRWLRYERLRHHFYGLERRWPESPFWRRRHGSSVVSLNRLYRSSGGTTPSSPG